MISVLTKINDAEQIGLVISGYVFFFSCRGHRAVRLDIHCRLLPTHSIQRGSKT